MHSKTDKYFRVDLLPALHGDCIWIEYGDLADPTRIVVDGGPIGAYKALSDRVSSMKAGNREVELFAITHVDGDHIEGAVRLIAESSKSVAFREVWFNGWRHLERASGMLGPVQGEFVSALIQRFIGDRRWNSSGPFCGGPLVVSGTPPAVVLEGGMKLTLLSPTPKKLEKLRKAWVSAVEEKGFTPGDLDAALELLRREHRLVPRGLLGGSYQLGDERISLDSAVANGSSLAFLAEFGGKRCLLLGDAHPDAVAESLQKLGATQSNPMPVEALKIAHHGSRGNTTPNLLQLVACKRFLVSTNGSIFGHPDPETIDMIIENSGPDVELFFNYCSDTTQRWSDESDQARRRYKAVYPQNRNEAGASLTL